MNCLWHVWSRALSGLCRRILLGCGAFPPWYVTEMDRPCLKGTQHNFLNGTKEIKQIQKGRVRFPYRFPYSFRTTDTGTALAFSRWTSPFAVVVSGESWGHRLKLDFTPGTPGRAVACLDRETAHGRSQDLGQFHHDRSLSSRSLEISG